VLAEKREERREDEGNMIGNFISCESRVGGKF
jgi:hypothetical protein